MVVHCGPHLYVFSVLLGPGYADPLTLIVHSQLIKLNLEEEKHVRAVMWLRTACVCESGDVAADSMCV